MANSNVLVDEIRGLSPSPEALLAAGGRQAQFATVNFQGGRAGFLDLKNPRSVVWFDVLRSLQQNNQPVYVEIEPNSNIITELLCPLTVRVESLTPTATGDIIEVLLLISHAQHYLKRTNPNFQQLLSILQSAQEQGTTVLVTEVLDTHEIIDVRISPKPLEEIIGLSPPPTNLDDAPIPTASPITFQRAQQLFDLVNAKVCCPASSPEPCIPFLFPDDGCWGRAHEMCRLIEAAGEQPEKIWIYGRLEAATHNNPSCKVNWGWHVAPTVTVNSGSGLQSYVIDPSLFPKPVTTATWKSVQGDQAAVLEPSPASVFHRTQGGTRIEYDDAVYTKTRQVLSTYRNQLKLRCASSNGPPPYLQCLSQPPGVQWLGTIAPNATSQWFSWGWPAAWHVIWTIMPLTPCPGSPQLSSTVQIERANANQCSYWITVKNLTPESVRFEGRYDILSR
jgi:hypothetical protein